MTAPAALRPATEDAGEALCTAIADRLSGPAPRIEPATDMAAEQRWAAFGLALLTGRADGPPALPDRDYAGRLDALLRAVNAQAAPWGGLNLGPAVFSSRAADLGLRRQGAVSCNGSARLLRCRDGWAAVNLAREEDADVLLAWVGEPAGGEPWRILSLAAASLPAADFVERGQLLGVPAAVAGGRDDAQWRARGLDGRRAPRIVRLGPAAERAAGSLSGLVVLDISSLWAGPLCGELLARLGARVIKVESAHRPDGARFGAAAVFDRLNAGKLSVALDFQSQEGRDHLARLIDHADVVIEASRPRALRQLGFDAEALAGAKPGRVWISLTAYGRTGPWDNRVGFGDDTAAAAGLLCRADDDTPMFLGDALADPIAGLTATAAALAAIEAGGGVLIDVALREAALFVADAEPALFEGGVTWDAGRRAWTLETGEDEPTVLKAPLAEPPAPPARALGADNALIEDLA